MVRTLFIPINGMIKMRILPRFLLFRLISYVSTTVFICRLLKNYSLTKESSIPSTVVFVDFMNNFSNKENVPRTDFEVGRILREVFPDLRRVQKRVNGIQTWHYTLSKVENLQENSPLPSSSTLQSVSETTDTIEWAKLPNIISSEFGWQLTSATDDYYEWIKLGSQDLCDGARVLYEVKIFKEWNFNVHVNNRMISKETLGLVDLKPSRGMINYLFDVLNKYFLCRGFQVPSKRNSKDASGNTTGKTEEWCSREDGTVVLQHRSVKCLVLLPNDFKRTTRRYCENCARLKRTSKTTLAPDADMERSTTAPKKRESFMSEDELREKLHHERTRRINAEKREKYLTEKINNEMKTFDEEDHKDFSYMFHNIEGGSVSEDMKVFWEEQEKALLAKSPRGYRWHPKYVGN